MSMEVTNLALYCKSQPNAPLCLLFIPSFKSVCEENIRHNSVGVGSFVLLNTIFLLIVCILLFQIKKKKAAVGRREFFGLYFAYSISILLRCLIVFIKRESFLIVWVSSFYIAIDVSFYVILVYNAIVGFQIVEDGSKRSLCILLSGVVLVSSLVAMCCVYVGTSYYSQQMKSNTQFYNPVLFVCVFVWPVVACLGYVLLQTMLIFRSLSTRKPLVYLYTSIGILIFSNVVTLIFNSKSCTSSRGKVDLSLLNQLAFLISSLLVYRYWDSITEDDTMDFDFCA